ncbi:helix-turn-helix domain-containing protein [Planctomicrobium sp. SH661]|uniref:helix-turn-helix domain-containing protein n=1 Tax=Planctomicrobium sp. SH661 TaxID=3448124 RepID=UPI003F5B41A4
MPQKTRRGLATWLTSTQTPLFVLDERRMVLVFNRGCEEFSQWSAGEVIGKICTFETEADPQRIGSLTGAICPPPDLGPGQFTRKRSLFHRKDGTVVERDIHFFPLPSSEAPTTYHVLGIITDPVESPAQTDSPHLEISRHTAELYVKYGVDRLVARSPAMERVAAQIELARCRLASVHLRGERGSGREHVARLIHYSGDQRQTRFVPLRCATASHFELFRTLQRLGEPGSNDFVGTVYLDDVTSLPGDLQPLVLEQLHIPHRRWVSSSALGLEGIAEEAFHPGLLSKLTAFTITVPPLRARLEDLPLLAQQILEECNSGSPLQHTGFSPAALRLLLQHTWPGNVDELSQVVQKACERSQTAVIEVSDLPVEFTAGLQSRSIRPLPHAVSLDEQVAQFERTRIMAAMKESRGNKTLAAEKLGIPRAKLYRRMEQLGLEEDSLDESTEQEG